MWERSPGIVLELIDHLILKVLQFTNLETWKKLKETLKSANSGRKIYPHEVNKGDPAPGGAVPELEREKDQTVQGNRVAGLAMPGRRPRAGHVAEAASGRSVTENGRTSSKDICSPA